MIPFINSKPTMIIEAKGDAAFVSDIDPDDLPTDIDGEGISEDDYMGESIACFRIDVDDTVTWHMLTSEGVLAEVAPPIFSHLEREWQDMHE